MAPIGEAVYATLLMNDAYLPGAMVLGHSLRDRGAKAKLACMVVVENLSSDTIEELRTVYDDIVPVQRLTNKSPANLYVMNRPDLISTFTKIELWRQTQYKRIVYLDADMVVLRAPNELLNLDTDFAAVPDIGWPDCFNSGMMVLNPNMADYFSLLALAQRGISFDGADQGLLNMHFTAWERLSFAYNCTPSGNYQYVPAYRHFQSSINALHFIGPDKPWTLGRENRFNHGVYGELLGRWWTTYDRHYRPQSTAYYSGQSLTAPKKVQDYVRGEETVFIPGYSSTQPQPAPPPPSVHVEPPADESSEQPAVEQPMGDTASPAEQAVYEDFQPTPTVEQRRFSAPYAEWEPARAPPPVHSKPEAANFPTTIYDMSTDTKLFQPPIQYPEAPKDMWYQVPEKQKEPERPKPIFPWEGRAPKPTRVFAEPALPHAPPGPEPVAEPEPQAEAVPGPADSEEPAEPPANISSPDPWAGFQARTNAWDEIPEIERYVQYFQQPRKGKLQVLHHTPPTSAPGLTSPPTGMQRERKPSMKLTDFPTEFERPSLPVTPAPIRRPSFWGSERDEEGNLPTAEGVPQQEEWNPVAKLEELQRKQSEVLVSPQTLAQHKELPTRQMPGSQSMREVEEADDKATQPKPRPKPILKEPKFELPTKEEVMSPDVAPDATAVNTTINAGSKPLVAEHLEDAAADKPRADTMTTVQS